MVLSNFREWKVNDEYISDLSLSLKLLDINYAVVVCAKSFPLNSSVTITYRDVDVVFVGIVTQCKKLAHTNDDGESQYEIEITEPAVVLKNTYLSDSKYSGVYILNTNKDNKKSLGQFVGYILGSDWVDISEPKYRDAKSVVGATGDTNMIPSVGLSVCTAWTALQRIIVNFFNYGIWFEYTNGNKCIRYGEYNRDIHTYPSPTAIRLSEKTTDYNVDGIIVYGASKTLHASVGNVSRGKKVVAYRYSGCNNMAELTAVANKIYQDRKLPRSRYELDFPAGFVSIKEGDRIHIYDDSMGLAENTDGYGVKDVKITMEKTMVGIGAASVTIFDVLSDRLSIIDGDMISYEPQTIDTGYDNIVKGASSGGGVYEYGATHEFDVEFKGETFMGDLLIRPYIADAGEQATNIRALDLWLAAATADSNWQEFSLSSASEDTGVYHHRNDWFPCDVDHIELSVEYIFDTSNTVGASAEWDVVWATFDDDAPIAYEIVPHGSTVSSSSVRRTVRHVWSVPSVVGLPFSYPKFYLRHSGSGTTTKIKDIVMTMVLYLNTSGDITLPNCDPENPRVVRMKLQTLSGDQLNPTATDLTPWLTVYSNVWYEGNSNNPTYIFDMMQHGVTIDNFKLGWVRIASQMASNTDARIRYVVTYTSVDETTLIIP